MSTVSEVLDEDVYRYRILGRDPETNLYVGFVPGIPGAYTQGRSLDELQKNLKEVLGLCLEEYQDAGEDLPRFVGLQKIEVVG